MFGRRDNMKTITESPVSEDGSECTFTYDYEDKGTAPFVRWIARELAAGRRFRAWHANEKARNQELATASLAAVAGRDEKIAAQDVKIRDLEYKSGFVTRDAEGFLERARKAEARAEAAEKRLHEPLPVVERTIWRVRAKAAELAALRAVPPGTDPTVRAVEFWRAVRKLGVPVDQVKGINQNKDFFEFFDFKELSLGGVFNTTVFEIG